MKANLFIIFIFVFGMYFLIGLPDYSGDIKNHVVWGKSILEEGMFGFYDRIFPGFSYPTYPPLVMAMFAVCFWLYEVVLGLVWFLNNNLQIFPSNLVHFMVWENTRISFLKIPGMIAAILTGFLLYYFPNIFEHRVSVKKRYLVMLLFLINPSVIYLSSIWGQTDLVQFFFLTCAFYLLFKDKSWFAIILASFSILSKQTAVPIWGIFMLTLLKLRGFKVTIKALFLTTIIFYLSYLPFHSPSLFWPVRFYQANFALVNFKLSENSINLWALLYDFVNVESNQNFLGITADIWSYLIFLLFFAPITILTFTKKIKYETFIHYLFLVSIIYFYTLTRMHERYLIPAIIFSSLLLYFGKKYWLNFIFFSALHFLNLYRGLFVPSIPVLNWITHSTETLKLLALIYGVIIFYNLYLFWKTTKLKND